MKTKDIIERAVWTFLQAFIASLVLDTTTLTGGVRFWRTMFIAAFAAGLSAVKTLLLDIIEERKEKSDGQD